MEVSPEPSEAQLPGSWGAGRGSSWECCGQGPGCLVRPSGDRAASTGPRAALGDSTGAFWPEEVTEKWVGASEGPRNSRGGQTLLLLRAGQGLAFLQLLPGHSPAPEQSAAQVAVWSSGGPEALPRRCSRGGRTSSGSWPWPPAALCARRAGQLLPSV
ncbi:hypothetical protein VULLAG_LOCUS3112 [Vulpes lagopus]